MVSKSLYEVWRQVEGAGGRVLECRPTMFLPANAFFAHSRRDAFPVELYGTGRGESGWLLFSKRCCGGTWLQSYNVLRAAREGITTLASGHFFFFDIYHRCHNNSIQDFFRY